MKKFIKNFKLTKYLTIIFRTFIIKPGILQRFKALSYFFIDLSKFQRLEKNSKLKFTTGDLFPRIFDRTTSTKLDPVYYLQGIWCARKVFDNKPKNHVDIGSQAQMVGIISQFVPTTMIDIRPLSVSVPELKFIKGDITKLPFADNSIESLSSICVIEHIGLGRYGDKLDQFGTEKSIKELKRVLAQQGKLYITVPVDSENKVYFNAHRAFTRQYILEQFAPMKLIEEKYVYGNDLTDKYNPDFGFGTGLFYFSK